MNWGWSIPPNRGYALSGGERRRVEIARCPCINPTFILLDEPFSGIDPIAVLDLQKIISGLRASGIGVLITDHNVRETLSVTDRAYIIDYGLIFRHGAPGQLVERCGSKKGVFGRKFFVSLKFKCFQSFKVSRVKNISKPLRCVLDLSTFKPC